MVLTETAYNLTDPSIRRKSGLTGKRDYVIYKDQSWTDPNMLVARLLGQDEPLRRQDFATLPEKTYVEFQEGDSCSVYITTPKSSDGLRIGPVIPLEEAVNKHIKVVNEERPVAIKKSKSVIYRTETDLYKGADFLSGFYIQVEDQRWNLLSDKFLSFVAMQGMGPIIDDGHRWYTEVQKTRIIERLEIMALTDKVSLQSDGEGQRQWSSNFSQTSGI